MGCPGAELDVERLIGLVSARPVIWDKGLEEYKCRAAATAAWGQVCAALHPHFESLDYLQQRAYVKLVIKKWVNVKDSWLRYNKKIWEQRLTAPGGKLVKKYVFSDQLQFLRKNYIHKESLTHFYRDDTEHLFVDFKNESNSTTENQSEGDVDITYKESVNDTYRDGSKFNNKFGLYAQPPPKKLKTSLNWTLPNTIEDRHMSFFRGILPTLSTLTENGVLEFQVGTMRLLKSIKDAQKISEVDKRLCTRCGSQEPKGYDNCRILNSDLREVAVKERASGQPGLEASHVYSGLSDSTPSNHTNHH